MPTNQTNLPDPSPRSLRQKLRERLRKNSRRQSKERKQFSKDAGGNQGMFSPNQVALKIAETKDRLQRLRQSMTEDEEPPSPPPTQPTPFYKTHQTITTKPYGSISRWSP